MENQVLEAMSHIKNASKNSPTAKKKLNHIVRTSGSNIDLSFVNETFKQLIANNKISDNFNIVEETESRNLNQSTDEIQALLNDELN